MSRKYARRKAIIRRRIFLSVTALVLVLVIATVVFVVKMAKSGDKKDKENSKPTSSSSNISSSSKVTSSEESKPQYVTLGDYTLDATYTELLLVNGKNPLPQDYNYEGNLVTIPQKYLKGELNQIDKNVWPYLQAMFDNARKEGIDIGCWSPYRSYNTQKWLFQRKINALIDSGTPKSEAEDKAATIVARPGTSEHHTGLALDINSASSSFEKTEAYKWLTENAEDYGFVMRYSKEKQEITGVIHESWHWRFVGINAAKEMNKLGYCLEEYVEYKNK